MHRHFGIGFMLALALLALVCPAGTHAQGGATVRTDPPTLEVGLGQQETLNFVLEDAQDVYGIDLRAQFDPAVIELVDADPSKEGIQMTPGPFMKPDFLVRNLADNPAGALQYVATQVNPTPPVSGRGVVLSVLVRGKALGKQTAFAISFIEIADRTGRKLPVRGRAGSVVVVQPKPPTPTPTALATATAAATPTTVRAASPVLTPRAVAAPSVGAAASASATPAASASAEPAATALAPRTLPAAEDPGDAALVGIAVAGTAGALAVAGAGIAILRRPRL